MKKLTGKQSGIYQFIVEWLRENGSPPTQAEIRDRFSFGSLNTVRGHLVLIEKKGYIRLNAGKARGIQLVRPPPLISPRRDESIPLLGTIAGGVPICAEQNIEDNLPIPPSFFGGGELFALRVSGDSMSGVGIMNGDIAIIQRQDRVENGEIAAVLIEQEATLKRVYFSTDILMLKAENPAFDDLQYSGGEMEHIHILGRYQGSFEPGKIGRFHGCLKRSKRLWMSRRGPA